jgi:hypothetical protein
MCFIQIFYTVTGLHELADSDWGNISGDLLLIIVKKVEKVFDILQIPSLLFYISQWSCIQLLHVLL